MTQDERIELLARINGLEDLARVESYRYPGGGLGFLAEAARLRAQL